MDLDRYLGCLVGLAVGDALGTTAEFKPPGSFPPVQDMVGGGPFDLQPGHWTDDTSMALCLAESLLECDGFDPRDQLRRYVRWYRTGYLSGTGRCFDVGNTVRRALETFERTGESYPGPAAPQSAGNGSLMRLAPVPMFYAADLDAAVRRSAESSRTTHQAPECLDNPPICGEAMRQGIWRESGITEGSIRWDARSDTEHLPQSGQDDFERCSGQRAETSHKPFRVDRAELVQGDKPLPFPRRARPRRSAQPRSVSEKKHRLVSADLRTERNSVRTELVDLLL